MATLTARAHGRLKLEEVSLELGEVLCEPWTEATHVYFPTGSLVSLIAVAAGGKGMEVGMVGRAGMFGVSLALGGAKSPTRALVQAAGPALRMRVAPFRAELGRNLPLQRAAYRYAYVAMATAMQIAACNNAHVVDERLARWLLMTSDQLSSNAFFLTQEFLAQMLGVRRTGVSEAGTRLQKRGLLSYRRGKVLIVDRPALIAAACGCYATIRDLTRE